METTLPPLDLNASQDAMEKTIKHLEQEFIWLQLGRASSGLVENLEVFVPSRGMKQKMNQVANIVVMDAQTLKIECWDKSIVKDVEKAIYDAALGFSPQNMGEYIMIKIPPLTQERRVELTKLVGKFAEENKIALRNIRQDALKEIKKHFDAKSLSEDQKKSKEQEVETMTKDHTTKIDTLAKAKTEEILKI